MAFSLLRMCGGYCKLVHLARATPPSHCADYLKLIDEEVRLCFTSCIAVDVPDPNWQQAQLSQSFGGLGFRSLALHCSAAFMASLASSGFGSADHIHMLQAVTRFNTQSQLRRFWSTCLHKELCLRSWICMLSNHCYRPPLQ